MPKQAEDLRVHGVSFEDAMKRMIATPPPPTSKKSKAAVKPKRKK